MKTSNIARIGIIAAAYCALTIVLAPLSYLMVQVRISEALTVLPFLFPQSIWGLFIGCLLANIYGGLGPIDIVFGSLATLTAGYLTSKMPNIYWAPLPPVLVNAVVVAFILNYSAGFPLWESMFFVGLGQLGACYGLGLPLLIWLRRYDWFKSSE